MKHAPSTTPPESTCTSGGTPPWIKAKTNTVPMNETGMCQVIVRRKSRYAAPSSRARALVSPMHPFTLPRKRSLMMATCDQSKPSAPFLTRARGVAVVAASRPCHADDDQVVIGPVKEMSMNARAASAGLNGLYPSPPNACLQMPIANTPPAAAIQSGRSGGRLRARRRPVRTAERSPMEFSRFMARRQSASVTRQAAMQVPARKSARRPKKKIAQPNAGRSAMMTSSMRLLTVRGPCACGELERRYLSAVCFGSMRRISFG